jgi:hypothetical protein
LWCNFLTFLMNCIMECRNQQIRSLATSMDIGYTNKEPGKFISMLLRLISVYLLSLKRNNWAKSLFQPFNPIATTNLWKVTCMVQISFSLGISTLQS